jgi:hypothetical protein
MRFESGGRGTARRRERHQRRDSRYASVFFDSSHIIPATRCLLELGTGLNVPLMAVIDYRGFRLLAVSILPISKDTLVYGSSDAGDGVFSIT